MPVGFIEPAERFALSVQLIDFAGRVSVGGQWANLTSAVVADWITAWSEQIEAGLFARALVRVDPEPEG